MSGQKKKKERQPVTEKNQAPEKPARSRFYKIFFPCLIAVVIVVTGVTGWTVYQKQSKPYREPALTINGVTYDMRYFINTAVLYYGNAPAGTTIVDFADFLEKQIEQNQTIIQGAQALGIPVDRDKIKADLKEAGKKATAEQMDIAAAEYLLGTQVPTTQPQYHVQAMLLESESTAQAALARVRAGESFEQVASEVTRMAEASGSRSDLGWLTPRQADLQLKSDKFGTMFSSLEPGAVSGPSFDDKVLKQYGYWVVKATEKTLATDNQSIDVVRIKGILLGSEQEVQDIINRLDSGADMDELARQYSQTPTANVTGAELGWIPRKSPEFDQFLTLFDRPLNTVVGPIGDASTPTYGGYWIFSLLEKNTSELTSYQYNLLKEDFLTRCRDAMQKLPGYEIQNLLTPEKKDLALHEAVMAQGKGSVMMRDATLPVAEEGVPYSFKITLYGEKKNNVWSITSGELPQGLQLNTLTGEISGTPVYAGASGFTLQVANDIHLWTQEFVLTIAMRLEIANKSLPDGQVGATYYTELVTMDTTLPLTWSISSGALPEGLSLNEYTGSISGTPAKDGTYSFTVHVDDTLAQADKTLTINVQQPAD